MKEEEEEEEMVLRVTGGGKQQKSNRKKHEQREADPGDGQEAGEVLSGRTCWTQTSPRARNVNNGYSRPRERHTALPRLDSRAGSAIPVPGIQSQIAASML